MQIRTLSYIITVSALLREILYSCTRMAEDSHAQPFAARFENLRVECKNLVMEEIDIIEAIARADAHATRIDGLIDVFATKTSRIVDENTSGASRKSLREALFKGKPLSKFSRPILGQQLAAMNDWGSTFTSSGIAQLQALTQEHDNLMSMAEQANEMRKAAQQKNRDFRLVGHRKQFIDTVNATRSECAGALGKIEMEQPGIPAGYAASFFLREPARDDEPTPDEIRTNIAKLEAELTEQKELLKKLEEEAEAERIAEEARKAQAQETELLEAQAEALLAKATELKKHAQKK